MSYRVVRSKEDGSISEGTAMERSLPDDVSCLISKDGYEAISVTSFEDAKRALEEYPFDR